MMIHFIRPFWLWVLIPVVCYILWTIYCSRQYNPWKNVCDSHLLPALLQPGPKTSKRFFYFTLFLFFILSILALAGPAWKKVALPLYRDVRSLVLVLDLSSTMLASDLKPNRLTRAKFKIKDIINTAKNVQMGLVAFTQEAFVASPLSQDANTLLALMDELSPAMMPISGSDIAQGVTQAQTLLQQARVHNGNILLITASEPTAQSLIEAKKISQQGSHLHVLAMFESHDTQTKLEQLAKAGNGVFYPFYPGSTNIEDILKNFTMSQTIPNENKENAYLWQDEGPWVCLFLIPLALIILREKVRS